MKSLQIDGGLAKRIMALNPDNVSEQDIRATLTKAPAPRILNIHGGIYPVYLRTVNFSQFLIGMGYPEAMIRMPKDGSYSFSPYGSSTELAGYFAWYYEREGMRPMVLGYSLGGFHVIKVLYALAGELGEAPAIYNPLTGRPENRKHIIDPLTGRRLGMDKLKVSYAHAVGAGGAARIIPNQWLIGAKLRTIPDTVEEFTGYFMEGDLIGADLLDSLNQYQAIGSAQVRTIHLPAGHTHHRIMDSLHLTKSKKLRDWINAYKPTDKQPSPPPTGEKADNILFAADVWFHVKRHWVLELQQLIKAKNAMKQGLAVASH
ncbi:MAG: hypothetical protein A2286_06260 [Gammaproteobacteria bacterium RIFOXYA12_FULL_61_12]|nr:MAG: hypothetical protein A2514_12810 [Gammaproteobacteria bacterium RIFOXYD12_FULL_61_37]OGT93737.1 MAG: hypothetical protein A2286_06260 [Gammaproteobacteria bacterium RIFOXYA12_FULL_61_12]